MTVQMHRIAAMQVLDACDALGIDHRDVMSIEINAQARQVKVVRHVRPEPDAQHWPLMLSQTEVYVVDDAPAA